jgi:hypothetical protein
MASRFCMALLHGRAGRLTALFGGSRPAQVACADGFAGVPLATCGAAGPYGLSGCVDFVGTCVQPADTAGYDVSEVSLDATEFVVQVACAAGYHGLLSGLSNNHSSRKHLSLI